MGPDHHGAHFPHGRLRRRIRRFRWHAHPGLPYRVRSRLCVVAHGEHLYPGRAAPRARGAARFVAGYLWSDAFGAAPAAPVAASG